MFLHNILDQGSQTQFTKGPLEAVFGCSRAAIGIPRKSSRVFSSAQISMKWLLMSRNRGVHETSVFWPRCDKGRSGLGSASKVYYSWRPHTYYIFFSAGGQKLLIYGPQMARGPQV